jgi:uncharacterized protein
MRVRGLSIVLPLVLAAAGARAERAVPSLTAPVIDEAGALDLRAVQALNAELRSYPPHVQLQVWIVPSLEGEPIENATIRAYDAWKLGTEKDSRGAILMLSIQERAVRIEVGRGLEGEIPDITASRIIREDFVPRMRRGDPARAVLAASRSIYSAAGGQAVPVSDPLRGKARRREADQLPLGWVGSVVLLVLLSFLRSATGLGSRRFRRGYGSWGGGGGWGGGWSGGGGGWGGGGGSSAGGGSSGNW